MARTTSHAGEVLRAIVGVGLLLLWSFDARAVAQITSPVDDQILGGSFAILGTADDPRFESYRVEYRPVGIVAWTLIASSTVPVVNGELASWDTIASGVPDGSYRVRLVVTDTPGAVELTSVAIGVDNTQPVASITNPMDEDEVAGFVDIEGTAFDTNFGEFALELRPVGTALWSLVAFGSTPVVADVLATWDTSVLAAGRYDLRLGVSDEAGNVSESVLQVTVTGLGDADDDEVVDGEDNCVLRANPSQLDADADEFGNACDGDFNQDLFSGGPDFDIFLQCFNRATGPGTGPPDDPVCEESDMNGDGFVGGPDFDLFLQGFNLPPGPSGLAACGLGWELTLLVPLLRTVRRLRRRRGNDRITQ